MSSLNLIFKRNARPLLFFPGFLALAWMFVTPLSVQESQAEKTKHCLWSIEGVKNTTYLLGSIHFMRSDAYPLAEEIENAYQNSKKIVFEINPSEMNDPALQAKTMALGLYPEGQTLKQNVSEEIYSLLEKRLASVGLPKNLVNNLKPWLCALTLTIIELKKLGFDPTHGIDRYYFDKSKKDGKEIIGLETYENQLSFFAQLNKNEEELFLKQTLKEFEIIENTYSEMFESWRNGNIEKLDSLLKVSFKEFPQMYNLLVVQRNKDWISKIENLIKQSDNVLIIVGAGHLAGQESVLELLKEKGYKVIQR